MSYAEDNSRAERRLNASLSFSFLWHSLPNYDPSAIIKANEHKDPDSRVISSSYVDHTDRQINVLSMNLADSYNRSPTLNKNVLPLACDKFTCRDPARLSCGSTAGETAPS